MKSIALETFTTLTEETMAHLLHLEKKVFEEPLSEVVLRRELADADGLLILLARVDEVVCGYKIGYQYAFDREYFYSWIGGVSPDFRGKGIATQLMLEQHRVVKERGFK